MGLGFDPVRTREVAASFALDFERQQRREEYLPHAVGNAACHTVGRIVELWLAGLEAETPELLARADRWLCDSEQRDEQFGSPPEFWTAGRRAVHGLCRWMIDGSASAELHRQAAELQHGCWPALTMRGPVRELGYFAFGYMGALLRDAILAGDPAWGCAVYDRTLSAVEQAGRKEPTGSKLAVALCRAVRDHGPASPQATKAGARLLKRQLHREWASRGLWTDLGLWLKAVVWNADRSLTPLQTILRGYDFMPDSVRERAGAAVSGG